MKFCMEKPDGQLPTDQWMLQDILGLLKCLPEFFFFFSFLVHLNVCISPSL